MKKGLIAVCLILAVAALGVHSGVASATDQAVPDEMVIKDSAFKKYKKPGVLFTHKKHTDEHGVKCEECHHVYKDGQNVWKEGDHVDKCSSCHSDPNKNTKLDGVKVLSTKNAYHKNCQTCHKEEKKGPTKCTECHVKQ